MSAAWRPLLSGREADDARREVARIATALAVRQPRDAALGPALLAGEAGIALFHAYAHLDDPAGGHLEPAEAWLESAVDRLAAAEHPLSLYTGAAGVAWVAHHLAVRLGAGDGSEAADLVETVDEAVLERVRETPWTGPVDLIHGLAGYGVYLLPRAGAGGTAARGLAEVVDRLGEGGPEDTGVAHGAAGILYVLAGAAANGCNAEKAGRLLSEGVEELLARGGEGHGRRLSWCRGDAGIAAALSAIGRRDAGPREIALRAAVRPPKTSGVEDAALCHGAAGLGHLVNRLHQAYGDPFLATRARDWLAEALRLRQQHPQSGGYPRLTAAPRDFLCGEAGIGLALLAAVSEVPPDWDQLLCASPGEDLYSAMHLR